jgi:hypothetical protein
MLWRIAKGLVAMLFNPREWVRSGPLALLALALPLAGGCATTKPLSIACTSCALLQSAALCPAAEGKVLAVIKQPCPKGQHLEIVNYFRWLDGEETPIVECRRHTVQ